MRWALPIFLLLVSCTTDQEDLAALRAERDTTCRSWGAQPGTPEYFQCRKYLQERADYNDAAAAGAMAGALGGMTRPPPPPPFRARCTSTPMGNTVSTNCY